MVDIPIRPTTHTICSRTTHIYVHSSSILKRTVPKEDRQMRRIKLLHRFKSDDECSACTEINLLNMVSFIQKLCGKNIDNRDIIDVVF